MFSLIANRLLRQFQLHNVQHAAALFKGFGQWVAYASAAAGRTLTPAEAAEARCKKVAAAVHRIAQRCPPDLPYLAAWFVDTHVPMLLAPDPPETVFAVYSRQLAPEQQGGFPRAVGPPFKPSEKLFGPLQNAWFPSDSGGASTLAKLFAKGARPPVSIRYIGPQCIRALDEGEAGREAITAMMLAKTLKAYPHSRAHAIPWDLHGRAEAYRTVAAGVQELVAAQSARQLFAAVCEYVVALTSQHPSLWRAVSCTRGGLQHIRNVQHNAAYTPKRGSGGQAAAAGGLKTAAATKIPSSITRRCSPIHLRQALLAPTVEETLSAEPTLTRAEAAGIHLFVRKHQAPFKVAALPEEVANAQRRAVAKATGSGKLTVAVCKTCTVIHRKIKGAPAPIKKRSSVSTRIENGGLTPATCAACGTSGTTAVFDAVGAEIRARVRHSDPQAITVMVCASCGSLAADTTDVLNAPRCKPCAKMLAEAPWPEAVTRSCVCGQQAASPTVLVKVAAANNTVKLLPVCQRHAAIARHIPPGAAVPAKWLRKLFRTRTQKAARTKRGRRRIKQYSSARSFTKHHAQ
jgi:hypothetical protein